MSELPDRMMGAFVNERGLPAQKCLKALAALSDGPKTRAEIEAATCIHGGDGLSDSLAALTMSGLVYGQRERPVIG